MVTDRTDQPPGTDTDEARAHACLAWRNMECSGTPYCQPRCPRYFDRTGTPILIQPPASSDWEPLAGMYETIESSTMGLPPVTRRQLVDWLDTLRERGWNLIAREGEQIVGHVSVSPAEEVTPEFVLFVHDDYQGRGIGTELVKQVIAYATTKEHEELRLTVSSRNRKAISVYTNVGFETTSQGAELSMRFPLDHPNAETVKLPPADRLPDE